jgi:hypothetical protein
MAVFKGISTGVLLYDDIGIWKISHAAMLILLTIVVEWVVEQIPTYLSTST